MSKKKKELKTTPGIQKAIIIASESYLKQGKPNKIIELYEQITDFKTTSKKPVEKQKISLSIDEHDSIPPKTQKITDFKSLNNTLTLNQLDPITIKPAIHKPIQSLPKEKKQSEFTELTEVLEDKNIKSSFSSIDSILEEISKLNSEYTEEEAYRDKMRSKFPKEIKPTFYPNPYNTDIDYTNKTGFFENIEGHPIFHLTEKNSQKINWTQTQKSDQPSNIQFEPNSSNTSELDDSYSVEQIQSNQNNSSLKTVELSYNTSKLFNIKPYQKYRKLFQKASMAIINNNLQEGLNYYSVLLEQNIDFPLKQMIKQTIQDIENSIMDQVNNKKKSR